MTEILATDNATATFRAERIAKTAEIRINTSVEKAFPLFGPLRERDWVEGWDPQVVYPTDTLAALHMIFKTKANFAGEDDYHWVITQFRPEELLIEYTVSTRDRIWVITVQCEATDSRTKVRVTYTYTGLTEKGNLLNRQALTKMFESNLQDWAGAINTYLEKSS